jgi:diguanylate cyclase (GGDEF)-like protein
MLKEICSFSLLVLFIFVITGCNNADFNERNNIIAKNGVIDLENLEFDEIGTIQLSGEWAFAWQSPYPTTLSTSEFEVIDVPGAWNKVSNFPSHGHGTYTLTLKNLKKDYIYGLRIPSLSSAYTLYIDGKKMSSIGVPGATKERSKPFFNTEEVFFTPSSNSTELSIYVSNFHHRDGGLWNSIELGTAKQIIAKSKKNVILEMLLLGSLILSSFYHLALFIVRKTQVQLLLFSLTTFIISIRLMVKDERILIDIWPTIPWSILTKIEYLSFYCVIPIFSWFLYYLYNEEVSVIFCKWITGVGLFFSAIVIFTPVNIFTRTLYNFQAIAILAIIYLVSTIFVAVNRGREGARVVATFGTLYAFTVIIDIFKLSHFLGTFELSNVGLFFFIFSQAYIITVKLFRAFDEAEMYSFELEILNQTLEEKISERTNSLEQSKLKLQKANDMLKKLSYLDQLTKIPNRRYLEDIYQEKWAEVMEDHSSIAFIYFDIDNFKKYNDTYGHQEGDNTLYKVGNTINQCIKSYNGVAARMGGEEFVAVVSKVSNVKLGQILEHCRRSVERLSIPHQNSPTSDYVTISIGAALVIPSEYDITQLKLIQLADEALYKAKENGRNKTCIKIVN